MESTTTIQNPEPVPLELPMSLKVFRDTMVFLGTTNPVHAAGTSLRTHMNRNQVSALGHPGPPT